MKHKRYLSKKHSCESNKYFIMLSILIANFGSGSLDTLGFVKSSMTY